jgi:hypothetical protein
MAKFTSGAIRGGASPTPAPTSTPTTTTTTAGPATSCPAPVAGDEPFDFGQMLENIKRGLIILGIALVINGLAYLVGRFVGDKLGPWIGFIAAAITAALCLLAISESMGSNNKKLSATTAVIFLLFFFIRLTNIGADARNNWIKEKEQEKVEAKAPNFGQHLVFGENVFRVKAGKTTPQLTFPAGTSFDYSISPSQKKYRSYFSDGTDYGPADQLESKTDPSFYIFTEVDDVITITVTEK